MAESSAHSIPRGCHGRVGRASATNAENVCERFFWALQGVNYNVYGIVSASGDLVERYEYTPYGRRTVYSRGWLRADLNGDGVVDSTDWDLYVYYRSHPQEGASIADYDGDGHVDMDGDGDRIDDQQGRSVADDPLVMYSRLESSRIDRQGWTAGGRGGYGSLCDIGHQGLLHDKEFGPASTGLVHNRRRTLNPPLARFNQRDPLGYPDGMNGYEYEGSRPIGFKDPSGEKAKSISIRAKKTVYFRQKTVMYWTSYDDNGQTIHGNKITKNTRYSVGKINTLLRGKYIERDDGSRGFIELFMNSSLTTTKSPVALANVRSGVQHSLSDKYAVDDAGKPDKNGCYECVEATVVHTYALSRDGKITIGTGLKGEWKGITVSIAAELVLIVKDPRTKHQVVIDFVMCTNGKNGTSEWEIAETGTSWGSMKPRTVTGSKQSFVDTNNWE